MATKKNKKVTTHDVKNSNKKNTKIMKILVFLGVIILCSIVVYLMYYFFVENNNIKINISTDKKAEFIDTGKDDEELITTQKYVSDLGYSMRYDTSKVKVTKYKDKDIFKYIEAEKILIVVEKGNMPNNCSQDSSEKEYNNCIINVDNYTEEHYISNQNKTYKLTVKMPNLIKQDKGIEARIKYTLNSFTIN